MKTRTLLILAFVCGVAILLAGTVKLVQVATEKPTVDLLQHGEYGQAGDMRVTVSGLERRGDLILVRVGMSGADEPNGQGGWHLRADGDVIDPVSVPAGVGQPCGAISASSELDCVVAFPHADTVQAVVYLRANVQLQWAP